MVNGVDAKADKAPREHDLSCDELHCFYSVSEDEEPDDLADALMSVSYIVT